MQLTKKNPLAIRQALAFSTAALLGHASPPAHAADNRDWEVDSAIMFYQETGRVSATEPILRLRMDRGDDHFLTLKFVADTLTGASPNGAIPTSSAQTFSGPSGTAGYTTPANSVPLDPTFHDARYAFNAEWEQPAGSASKSIYGVNFSTETDYQSIGLSATYNFDFNQHDTTLTTGIAANADSVQPIGGTPLGLSTVVATPAGGGKNEGEGGGGEAKFNINKHVYDLLLGITQVMSRQDLVQFNINAGKESGYLTDPYKILSVVDTNGALIFPDPYVHEKRPDNRGRMAFYSQWSHQFTSDVLRLAVRHYSDTWGISSNTLDAHYRLELGQRQYLEPHYRYYKQTAADFYHTSLRSSDLAGLNYASADYRLADMSSKTLGLKYGLLVGKRSEVAIRVETITQHARPSEVIGVQNQQILLPDIKASIIQLNYSTVF
ncbi:MAG: DUF3570 domain-containing protein [Gammaproteobacteria bacterium]|nr:DUF3570 domain-containing protein [Gammaproteobacteria bacterium]